MNERYKRILKAHFVPYVEKGDCIYALSVYTFRSKANSNNVLSFASWHYVKSIQDLKKFLGY